jgi:Domain of unknown function (DUF4169)
MAELVNLRLARKRKARAERAGEAAANRAKHGATKAERQRLAHEDARADHTLDAHKIERAIPDKNT